MSKITNNERIINLIVTHAEFERQMVPYLAQLKQRYTWKNDTRRAHGVLKSQIIQARRQVQSAMTERSKLIRESKAVTRHIKRVARQLETTIADEYRKTSPLLAQLASARQITAKQAESYVARLNRTSGVELMGKLIDLLKIRIELRDSQDADAEISLNGLYQMMKRISENELASLKEFRQALESEELQEKLKLINAGVEELGINAAAVDEKLAEPSKLGIMPSAVEFESILHAGRAPVYYVSRGYTVLPYVKDVYSAMNYMQRALRERRKYQGTVSALKRYTDAVSALDEYYQAHYTQNDATPRNYHGHYANEHD